MSRLRGVGGGFRAWPHHHERRRTRSSLDHVPVITSRLPELVLGAFGTRDLPARAGFGKDVHPHRTELRHAVERLLDYRQLPASKYRIYTVTSSHYAMEVDLRLMRSFVTLHRVVPGMTETCRG